MNQLELDNEDCIRIRALANDFNIWTKSANKAVCKWMTAEMALDKALITNHVKETMAREKQIISLIAVRSEYDCLHTEYCEGKMEERIAMNTLKAIEMEINALKKIFDETPK